MKKYFAQVVKILNMSFEEQFPSLEREGYILSDGTFPQKHYGQDVLIINCLDKQRVKKCFNEQRMKKIFLETQVEEHVNVVQRILKEELGLEDE